LQKGFRGYKEFKAAHGFRKYFKSKLEGTSMKTSTIELLMEHQASYDKRDASLEELSKSYAQSQHVLFIDPKYSQSDTIAKQRHQLEEENRKFTERVKQLEGSKVDAEKALVMISGLSRKLEEIEQERIREKAAKLATLA
jgi:hypothetical protein